MKLKMHAFRKPKTKQQKILYLCDRRACEKCSYPDCQHTTDVYHARNFERIDDIFVEGTVEETK